MDRAFRGYSLLETIISFSILSIATIGIVIPILTETRELSRRMTCQEHLRQWGEGVLALENAHRVYPSGGIEPWPAIEDYTTASLPNPKPLSPKGQGLGWMYQTLPYLMQPIEQPTDTDGVYAIESQLFFCPARRPPTRNLNSNTLLNDYAGMAASPSRFELGDTAFERLLGENRGCRSAYGFWGIKNYGNDHRPRPKNQLGAIYVGFRGVFVRSSYYVSDHGSVQRLGYDPLTTIKRITDGTSRTGMITEKSVLTSNYRGGRPGDDRGWSDGWDLDTMRSTYCQPRSDSSAPSVASVIDHISPGSAHDGGLFVVLADGGVRFVNFDIDLETWNRLGHRSDGEYQQAGFLSGTGPSL